MESFVPDVTEALNDKLDWLIFPFAGGRPAEEILRNPAGPNFSMDSHAVADVEEFVRNQLAQLPHLLTLVNEDGDNPIAVSLLQRQSSRAAFLIKLAAERQPEALEQRSCRRETHLMLSTMLGEDSNTIVQLLVHLNPASVVSCYDTKGNSVLHHFADEISTTPMKYLLNAVSHCIMGGRIAKRDFVNMMEMNNSKGDTVLHYVARHDKVEMLQLLYELCRYVHIGINYDVAQICRGRRTPLMLAAVHKAERVCKFLLDHKLVKLDLSDPAEFNDEEPDPETVEACNFLNQLYNQSASNTQLGSASSYVAQCDSGYASSVCSSAEQQQQQQQQQEQQQEQRQQWRHVMEQLQRDGQQYEMIASIMAQLPEHHHTKQLAQLAANSYEAAIGQFSAEPPSHDLISHCLALIGRADLLPGN